MAPPPTGAELPVLPVEMLTEILLRVSTPSTLVHAAAASKSCRTATIADPKFLARYRARNTSSPFLGVYVPRELAGPPSFLMPDSIRLGGAAARDLKDAARRAFDFGETRRYQDHRVHDDAFILGSLEIHPDCRILDCHNSRLLLTRGDEALEVRSPLARESILIPFPPDVVDPYDLQACLLQGHDKAAPASFRVVFLQHRRLGRGRRQTRAVEYDSRRKSWQDHPWETITSNIEGTPEELMHAGHRIFCRYRGLTSAALMLDTNSMQFSVLPLPKSHQSFVIGEIEDNVCCFVESVGCADHRLRVWQLDEKLCWDLKKDVKMDQVLGGHVGYYRPRAISNGIALVCSTTTTNHHHFVVDLKTCSMKEKLEFQGQFAYPMQMPWPPVFSGPTANAAGGFDRDGGPTSVGDTRIGVGLSECIAKLERNTKAIADVGYQIAAILQDLKINAKPTVASGPPSPGCRVHGGSATNGFDDGGLAKLSVGDANTDANARTGAKESDEINDPSPGPSVGGCISTNPLSEAKKAQLLYSSSIACFVPSSSTAPSALMPSTTAGSPSCPHQVKKRAGSRQSKGSPKAMGLVRRNWKRKPKHLKTIDQRRRHLFSIASKICEVQIATSSCREASTASTASVFGGSGSTLKITDVGKQRIIDVSVTGAPSFSDTSAGESAEQRGEAAQDSNEPQDRDIQDPTATPTSATTEQSFGKGKNYVSNDYLIPDICDPFSDLMNPKAAGGFGWDAEPAFVGNTRSGSGESDTVEDLFSGTLAMAPPAAPTVEPEELLIWRSRSPFCVQSLDNDLLLQPPTLASCPQQGRKQADSRESKGSPEAKGPGKRNWKRPKYLEAIFDLRRHQSSSIASKISDEVHITTSSCTGESAASTAAVSAGECIPLLGGSSSTLKFTDVGKQPIIDVSITGAPSLSDPSAAESAEQRGKAAQDSNEPQDIDIQDPTAIAPTSVTTEQSFGKDKNYVSNDYLISDEVQIATSSCTEESAASTASVGSTFTDSGKQPIIDVSITRDTSLFYPTGELAEQRGEAVRGKGSPEAMGRGRREKKLNPKYTRGDWLFDDDCPVKARATYHQPPPPRSAPPKDTFPPSSRRHRRFAATMAVEGEGKNPAGGGGGDNLQNQQAVLQAAPAPAVQGEAAQEPEVVAVEDPDEAAATSAIQEEMKAPLASIPDGVAAAFTAMQLQELEQQSRVCQYMAARVPVPTHLVFPVWKSVTGASFEGAQKYPTLMGLATLCLDFEKNSEPEPGRCRRTDGLKWRCRRSAIPNEKYCERHMHRGRKRPVRVV